MTKKVSWFEIVLVIVFMGAQFYAAFAPSWDLPNKWFIRDDAYYYFNTAKNISEGHGSTFDGIHPTNGYHPLWMLVCIPLFALARFDPILPLRILVIITGAFQAGTAVLLYRLIRSVVSPPMGMLAAIFWVFDTYILPPLYKPGLESGITLFLISLLLYLLYKFEKRWRSNETKLSQIAWLAVTAILVTMGRLDLVFFSLVVGLWIIFRDTPMRYLLPMDILAILIATVLAFILRLGLLPYYDVSTSAIIMIIMALIIEIPAFFLGGLYQPPANWKASRLFLKAAISVFAGSLILSVMLIGGTALGLLPTFSRAVLLIDAGLTFVFILLLRAVAYLFHVTKQPKSALSPLEQVRDHWKAWLREGAVYYGIVGGILSAYMLWNKLVFGSFSPVSGLVKRWLGTFIINIYGGAAKSPASFFGMNPFSDFDTWEPVTGWLTNWANWVSPGFINSNDKPAVWQEHLLLVITIFVVIVGVILLLRKKKTSRTIVQTGMIPLLVGSWTQILSYNITGYASVKEWYWLTEPFLIILVIVLLIDIGLDIFLKKRQITRIIMWAAIGLFAMRTGYIYLRNTYFLMPYHIAPANSAYVDMLPLLEKYTKPGDVIGMTGGGNVGYFIRDRTIVNMDGLINSNAYFEALKNGTGSDYLYNTGMRYVFANPNILEAIPYHGQYTNRLKAIAGADWGGKSLNHFLPDPEQ